MIMFGSSLYSIVWEVVYLHLIILIDLMIDVFRFGRYCQPQSCRFCKQVRMLVTITHDKYKILYNNIIFFILCIYIIFTDKICMMLKQINQILTTGLFSISAKYSYITAISFKFYHDSIASLILFSNCYTTHCNLIRFKCK